MNKKFIFINIIMILLLIAFYILGYYLMNYPMIFDLMYIIKECKLEYLAVIFAITAVVSYLISHLNIKNSDSGTRFLKVFPFINFLFLIFFIYIATDEYIKRQKEMTKIENTYIQQAQKDIKNDHMTIKYADGLSIPSYEQKTINQIDSIQKKYGVSYTNIGCTVDLIERKAQEKYTETVNPYLEQRNGKGWENRMQKEIDDFKETLQK